MVSLLQGVRHLKFGTVRTARFSQNFHRQNCCVSLANLFCPARLRLRSILFWLGSFPVFSSTQFFIMRSDSQSSVSSVSPNTFGGGWYCYYRPANSTRLRYTTTRCRKSNSTKYKAFKFTHNRHGFII